MTGSARRLVRRYAPASWLRRFDRAEAAIEPATGVAEVRRLLDGGDITGADALSNAQRGSPSTSRVGALTAAIVAQRRGFSELAWSHFRQLGVEAWAPYAMREYVRSGLLADPDVLLEHLETLAAQPSAGLAPNDWYEALGPAFGLGRTELAQRLFERMDTAIEQAAKPTKRDVRNRDWIRRWISKHPDSPTAADPAPGVVSFAVLDYGHPERTRASANIGDHVQSLAALGHLVRHVDLEYVGDDDLVSLLGQLSARVPVDRRITGTPASVEVRTVDRDASTYAELPPRTWTFAFGWFMHSLFQVGYAFPLHRNLLPIFVSFHCNKRGLLTEEAVRYLRRYGPVGCRDWTTVDILLSLDVPAFFSGCLTTTIDTVLGTARAPGATETPGATESPSAAETAGATEASPARASPSVAYVDAATRADAGGTVFRHSANAIRGRSFVRNVTDAVDLLERYRDQHSSVVTSRLHAYLPCRSLGLDVELVGKNMSDLRFEGLVGISDEDFDTIRTGLLDKFEAVTDSILAGEEPTAVYDLWRNLTADDVAAARRRRTAAPRVLAPTIDVDTRAAAASVRRPTDSADGVQPHVRRPTSPRSSVRDAGGDEPLFVVAHAGRQGSARLRNSLAVLVQSVLDSTSRPVELVILTRAADNVDLDAWASMFAQTGIRLVVTAGLDTGADSGPQPRSRDLDLLMLPTLLPQARRAVVLPTDAVALTDIADLVGLDLRGQAFAAPTVVGPRRSGFGALHAAAFRLGDDTAASAELRRLAHARHRFDFDACNTDVLVLDLERMRKQGFAATNLGYGQRFGLDLAELLSFVGGADRVPVPPAWNAVPTRVAVSQPRLVHWADRNKPWRDPRTPGYRHWADVRGRLT